MTEFAAREGRWEAEIIRVSHVCAALLDKSRLKRRKIISLASTLLHIFVELDRWTAYISNCS
jgi:hypothetical protein